MTCQQIPASQPCRTMGPGARAPRRHSRGTPLLLGVLAMTTLGFAGCKQKSETAAAPPPPQEVIVATPVERDVTAYLNYTGVVEASETVDLRARVQGFLQEIRFKPGQRVKKGDVLFVIDKRQYIAAVERAEAAVRAQQAALVGAENDARLARELADQRAGPEIDAVIKSARRDVIAADLASAEAALSEARLNLEYCEIVAPINGRISRNYVDTGNLVGRGEPTLLATIVQATPAYVPVNINEGDVLAARRDRARNGPEDRTEPGQVSEGEWRPSEVALADEKEFKFKGRVDYVDPRVNAETGTLYVRTRYENEDETLIPGLFVRVRFPMGTKKSLLVPEAALLRDQIGRFALVVNDEDEVEIRRIKLGVLEGPLRVVEEGLSADDRIVVLGVLKARPGSKVTPKTQKATAGSR